MSYSILIGEAVVEAEDPEEWDGLLVAHFIVKCVEVDDAPCFENDANTHKTNGRHPGYGAWADFVKSVGLHDLFFDKSSGLMRKHPGTVLLTKAHEGQISKALKDYRQTHPDTKPGFTATFVANSGIVLSDARQSGASEEVVSTYHLARLIWLDWWVRWALKNCKRPAIHNH